MHKTPFLTLPAVAAALALGGCPTPAADDDDDAPPEVISFAFENSGDASLEGHTPRGFQGQGGGLFVGDNLNGGFPEGDGVQIFLTVDLEDDLDGQSLTDVDWLVQSAILRSENFDVRGDPFEDLGDLTAEEIRFDMFSSSLWDASTESGGASCTFGTSADGPFECDLAEAVQNSLDDGYPLLQLRFRLDEAGDSDGAQDMVMFFIDDSNSTQPGIFELEVDAVRAQ